MFKRKSTELVVYSKRQKFNNFYYFPFPLPYELNCKIIHYSLSHIRNISNGIPFVNRWSYYISYEILRIFIVGNNKNRYFISVNDLYGNVISKIYYNYISYRLIKLLFSGHCYKFVDVFFGKWSDNYYIVPLGFDSLFNKLSVYLMHSNDKLRMKFYNLKNTKMIKEMTFEFNGRLPDVSHLTLDYFSNFGILYIGNDTYLKLLKLIEDRKEQNLLYELVFMS